jgi:hypothetical protein
MHIAIMMNKRKIDKDLLQVHPLEYNNNVGNFEEVIEDKPVYKY